jgi:flagellar hook-associated protein 1
VVADLRSGLDSLASQIVSAVNNAYSGGGTYSNFFDASGTTAATIAFDPSLTADTIRSTNTSEPGANELALAMANLANTSFATGSGDAFNGTFGTFYRGLVSNIANEASSANSRLDDQTTLRRLMLERRDSISGVSLDEEMTDLVKYQRAFDASARVMRAIDELLQTVIEQLGR